MRSARGRSALALLVILALLVLFALPVVASAEETEAPAEVSEATAEETNSATVAPVEVTTPAEPETAIEEAPVPETVPASTEAAPEAVEAVSKTPAANLGSSFTTGALGRRAVANAKAAAATQKSRKPARASGKVTKLSSVPNPNCSGTVASFGLSAPTVTAVVVGTVASTQFSWTVTYSGTDGCGPDGVSNIVLTPCLVANGGNYTHANDPTAGTYKWDNAPIEGAVLTLTFPGTVASGGTIGTTLKKSTLTHSPAVTGPSCAIAQVCSSWSLDVDVTNTGFGTGTVSDNHGNTIGVDATWTYNATQMADVDITATGTNGSSASNTGQSNVTFSAHPNCDADYSVIFDRTASVCTSWSLDVDVTNTGIGTGTVTDNHGNSTGVDATWTYNATQMTDVDVTATGTNGSNASNSGASDVVFSARPNCDADYSVTFDRVDPTCTSWTLDVDVTNTGIGTGTVTDNHGNSTDVDATWTYNGNQVGDVDLSAAGTNGSSHSNSGASNVAFSAHPDCNADYSVTFNKDRPTPDCNGDFDSTNNGPNVDCTVPPTPDCNGDFDSTNNGPNGDCTIPPTPDCNGDFDSTNNGPNGDCTEEPPTDVCPNIDDVQTEVPDGMVVNPVTGDCEEDEVLGEIIDKDPQPGKSSKPEPRVDPQEVAPAVLPSNVQAGVLPFTGSDLLPLVIVAGLLMALGTAFTVRRTAEARK